MIKFLRKILGIQTLKILLVSDGEVRLETLDWVSRYPIKIVITRSGGVKDIRIIDTGIPIRIKKKEEPNGQQQG